MRMKGLQHPDKSYFLTLTVIDWIDVFTRLSHISNFKFWKDGNHAIEVYSEHVSSCIGFAQWLNLIL